MYRMILLLSLAIFYQTVYSTLLIFEGKYFKFIGEEL